MAETGEQEERFNREKPGGPPSGEKPERKAKKFNVEERDASGRKRVEILKGADEKIREKIRKLRAKRKNEEAQEEEQRRQKIKKQTEKLDVLVKRIEGGEKLSKKELDEMKKLLKLLGTDLWGWIKQYILDGIIDDSPAVRLVKEAAEGDFSSDWIEKAAEKLGFGSHKDLQKQEAEWVEKEGQLPAAERVSAGPSIQALGISLEELKKDAVYFEAIAKNYGEEIKKLDPEDARLARREHEEYQKSERMFSKAVAELESKTLNPEQEAALWQLRNQLREHGKRMGKLLEQHRTIYGPKFYEILDQIDKMELDGTFTELDPRKLKAIELEVDEATKEESRRKRIGAKRKINDLFERIVTEAETDPRQFFQFRGEDYQLWGEFLDRLEAVDSRLYYEYQSWWVARRLFHNLSVLMEQGGDLESLQEATEKMGHSRDRTTIVQRQPGLGAALRFVEKELGSRFADPRTGGLITREALSLEGGEDTIVQSVADRLLELSRAGEVWHGRGEGRYQCLLSKEEAQRVAVLALKISNADMRTADYVAQAPLLPRTDSEYLSSPPFEKVVQTMNPVRYSGERLWRFSDSYETMERLITRMNSLLPTFGTSVGDEFILETVNPQNLTGFGSMYSRSSWRAKVATQRIREGKDLALGLQLLDIKEEAGRLKEAGEEGKEDEIEKDLRKKIWRKVSDRFPSRVLSLLPTLTPELLEEKEFISEKNKKGLKAFAQAKAKTNETYIADIDLIEKSKYSDTEKTAKKKARLEDEEAKQRAEYARFWMIGEKFKIEFPEYPKDGTKEDKDKWVKDCDGKVEEIWDEWRKTQKKLWVLEEVAMRRYSEEIGRKEKEKEMEGKSLTDEERAGIKHEKILEWVGEIASGKEKFGDIHFSEQERELVERLTHFGATSEEKGKKLVGRLAEQKQFDYTPFLDDVLHEETEWGRLGARGYGRRYGDGVSASGAANAMFTLAVGMSEFKDGAGPATRKDLFKYLVEFKRGLSQLKENERQTIMATLACVGVEDLYMVDNWVEGRIFAPLLEKVRFGKHNLKWLGNLLDVPAGFLMAPVGFALDMPLFRISTSAAQRRFGKDAVSMTTKERYKFLRELRPQIGADNFKTLQRLLRAKWVDMALADIKRYWMLALLTISYTMLSEFVSQLEKQGIE